MTSTHPLLLARLAATAFLLLAAGCNTTNGFVNNSVGMNLYRRGNYEMARDEFQRAVYNDPDNASYRHNLASALRKQGDFARAEESFRHAIAVDPSHQPSYHNLAAMLKEQGRTSDAMTLLVGWADQQPYAPAPHIELAALKRELGDYAGAEQSLQMALQARPNDPIATAHLGQLYQETNQPERAVAMYRRSLFTRWGQPEIHSRLARLEGRSLGGPFSTPGMASSPQPTMAGYASGYPLYPTTAPANTVVVGSPTPIATWSAPLGGDPAHTEAAAPSLPVVTPH
jgi:Flp pilus assembly protein TadD